MNNKIKSLIQEAGFSTWSNEMWAAGEPGDIDWSSNYTQEMNWFIQELVHQCAETAAGSQGGYKVQVYDAVVSRFLHTDDTDDTDDHQPSEQQEWNDFDPDC